MGMKCWKVIIDGKEFIQAENGVVETYTARKWNKIVKRGDAWRNLSSDEMDGIAAVKDGSAFNYKIISR